MNDIKMISCCTYVFGPNLSDVREYGGTYMVDDVGTPGFPDFPLSCC